MIKRVLFFIALFIFIIIPTNVQATSLEEEFAENNSEFFENSIPRESEEFFEENDIDITNINSIKDFSLSKVFKYIINKVKYTLTKPIKLLGLLIGIILLLSIINNVGTENMNNSLYKVFNIIGVLVCLCIIYKYISESIDITSKTLQDGSNFMLCYVPVFAGVVAAGGLVSSASIYNMGVLGVSEIAIQIANNFLLPLMALLFALSIIESINPSLSLSGFTSGVKKFIQWSLGLLMTIFVGVISIQGIVGTSTDTIGIRTAKFMASSFIPVIGGAISDAYSTLRGSIGLLRSGVGSIGIIVLLLTILPPILFVFSIKISLSIGSFVAELLGIKSVSSLLKNSSSVLSIAVSLLICFALMLIVATTIMMMLGLNVS